MDSVCIYLDESGDLGWTFNKPYRAGGSSRYLTIASVIVDHNKRHLPKRLMKRLYQKYGWNPRQEKKWSQMNRDQRQYFAERACVLSESLGDALRYVAITVNKKEVAKRLRRDPKMLYNYMIAKSLVEEMSVCDKVRFYPDPVSVKMGSANTLHDYLSMELLFEQSAKTELETLPADSAKNVNVQFADMLCGAVQSHFEDDISVPWNILEGSIYCKQLKL